MSTVTDHPVLKSIVPVIEVSKFVRTNVSRAGIVAEKLKDFDLPQQKYDFY